MERANSGEGPEIDIEPLFSIVFVSPDIRIFLSLTGSCVDASFFAILYAYVIAQTVWEGIQGVRIVPPTSKFRTFRTDGGNCQIFPLIFLRADTYDQFQVTSLSYRLPPYILGSPSPFIFHPSFPQNLQIIYTSPMHTQEGLKFVRSDGNPSLWPRCERPKNGKRWERLENDHDHSIQFLEKLSAQLTDHSGRPR